MLPKLLLLSLAPLVFPSVLQAVPRQSGKIFKRYDRDLSTARLDLETGVVSRGASVQSQAASTVVEFANLDISGFIATETGSCACEWIDAGIKGHNGNASDLMSNLVFVYCSSALDVNSGGPGGTVALGFYEGYQTGGSTPTTTAAAFTLVGLPANTTSSSFLGFQFHCSFMQVDLANLVCFADGPIGYGWKFMDGTGPGTLAQTFPFLSCVQSCSGIFDQGGVGGPNLMDNFVDQYCPPGFLRSSFTFGSTSPGGPAPFYTSLAMEIREVVDCPATLVSNVGQGLNLDVQSAPPAVVGRPWSAAVTLNDPGQPATGFLVLLFNADSLATGPRLDLGNGVTELLIGPASLAQPCPVSTYAGGSGATCVGVVIPKDPGLIGVPWCTQVFAGTPAAGWLGTNSLCGVVGTQ